MSNSIVDLLEAYPLPEQESKPPYKLYCDMDGVLTDFESRFHEKLNTVGKDFYPMRDISKVEKPKDFERIFGMTEFWKFIDQTVGVGFWSGMNWMPNGERLWNFIKGYTPELLTSPSRDNTSRLGKQLWAKHNLDPKPRVIFAYSADKKRYANENSILIDDKPSNIEQWRAAGGIAFRVKNGDITEAINGLKELGYEG